MIAIKLIERVNKAPGVRSIRRVFAVICVAGGLGLCGLAQVTSTTSADGSPPSAANNSAANSTQQSESSSSIQPDLQPSPCQQSSEQQACGDVLGTVEDSNGNVVSGAVITLQMQNEGSDRTQRTDRNGFFNFSNLPSGTFHLSVASQGFVTWTGAPIQLAPGQHYVAPEITLQIASANTSIRVVLTRQQIAEQQLHAEEKQRILGILPNFYTTYDWNAEPLNTKQKFQLAWKSSIDPVIFVVTGVIAGLEQSQNYFPGYGSGAEGYAKRYGASYADGFIGNMIGGAILPSILHQDPRYFYKGTGSVTSRALYAIATVVITKGDNGRWQPNYSNVLGTFAAAGISNLYYPASNQSGAQVTIDNSIIGLAAGAGTALLQEFVFKKLSRGVPATPNIQVAPAVQH